MKFKSILHPTPELVRLDTSLRYTDILFGFVISQIFVRLQYWQNLERHVSLHLGVCLALVLGSWIGYRRSVNRSSYEVKFFNLPFFRFLLDQGMLILYFQIAGSTSVDIGKPLTNFSEKLAAAPDPAVLVLGTVRLLVFIFLLYWVWDILAIWMATSEISPGMPRYPDAKDNTENNQIKDKTKKQKPGKVAFGITSAFFLLFGVLWILLNKNLAPCLTPTPTFVVAILLLVGYRLAKEIRTSHNWN